MDREVQDSRARVGAWATTADVLGAILRDRHRDRDTELAALLQRAAETGADPARVETGWRLYGYQQAGAALIERLPVPARTDVAVTALLELTATWAHTAPAAVERWNAPDMDRLVVLVLGEVDAELGERAEAWLARHPITAPLTLPLIAPTGADPALQVALHTLATAYLGSLLPAAAAEHQALADRAAALTAALR